MLQVGAQAFRLERGPEDVLLHGQALGREHGEVVGVSGELFLHLFDGVLVVEKEDRACGGPEARDAIGRVLPAIGGDDGLESVSDDIP